MESSQVQTRNGRYLKWNIRDLFALSAIVALAIALYFANAEKSELERKLNVQFPRPHVWLHDQSPLEIKYMTNANIAMTGQLYPNYNFASKTPSVSAKLLDPTTGTTLCNTAGFINPNGDFHFTINHGKTLRDAFYPIVVEIFDGQERIAFSTSTVQIVNEQNQAVNRSGEVGHL